MIAKGRLKEALDALGEANADSNDVVLLQARLNSLERSERLGTISHSDASIERAKIAQAVLSLTDGLEEPFIEPNQPNIPDKESFSNRPAKIYFSYARKDAEMLEELKVHLSSLRRLNKIEIWDDTELQAGEVWDEAIKEKLDGADIIILLVSAQFLASDYIWDVEMKEAIERHEREEARVIPVILRPCDWRSSPFSKFQALPSKGRPITEWSDRDAAWIEVVRGIERVIDNVTGNFNK